MEEHRKEGEVRWVVKGALRGRCCLSKRVVDDVQKKFQGNIDSRRPRAEGSSRFLAKVLLLRVSARARHGMHREAAGGSGHRRGIHLARGRGDVGRRSEGVEEAGGRSDARGRESGWAREGTREASVTILRRSCGLAARARYAGPGQVSRQLVHLLLLPLVLQVQELHVFFESPFLLPHVLDVLALLLKLEPVRRIRSKNDGQKGRSNDR